MYSKVFTNRTLNLRKIKYIGLDMDHTLVQYNTKEFEMLSHNCMKEKLVARGYPEIIKELPFDFDQAIRGLVVDASRGNLLKLSRHGAIRASRHGTKRMDFQTQRKVYTGTYVDLNDPNFSAVDTAFSISVAILYMQLVDYKEANPDLHFPEFKAMYDDVVDVLDESHRDGSIKNVVAQNLEKFIIKNEKLVQGLERFIKHDKKIFIVTNSDFHYTKLLLDHAVDPFLKDHKSWMDLFFVVITLAQKPRFFFDNLRFLKIDPKDGSMTNMEEKLVDGIYQGGCADIFEADFGVAGDDILYVGDHIYGDIVRLKKDCKWRTALVLEELGDEIDKMEQVKPIQDNIRDLMDQKEPLEHKLVDKISERIEKKVTEDDKGVDELQEQINDLDKQISPLIKQQASIFNSHWGEVMRAGNEESYFAHQVDRFADIYMPNLADLFSISPRTYFRARRRPLAHELAMHVVLDEDNSTITD